MNKKNHDPINFGAFPSPSNKFLPLAGAYLPKNHPRPPENKYDEFVKKEKRKWWLL